MRMDRPGSKHLKGRCRSVYGRGNRQISLLEAATNFLEVFNMSGTTRRFTKLLDTRQTLTYAERLEERVPAWG